MHLHNHPNIQTNQFLNGDSIISTNISSLVEVFINLDAIRLSVLINSNMRKNSVDRWDCPMLSISKNPKRAVTYKYNRPPNQTE